MFGRSTTRRIPFFFCATLALVAAAATAGTERLTFQELMKFRQIEDASIAKDGRFIAYGLRPDRGEGEAVARAVDGDAKYRVERGSDPILSADSRWMACAIEPTQEERDEAAKKNGGGKDDEDDGPRKGLALVSLTSGEEVRFEEVESFALSEDGRWLARKHHEPKKDKGDDEKTDEGQASESGEKAEKPGKESEEKPEEGPEEKPDDKKREDEDRPVGTALVLRDLGRDGRERTLDHVVAYSFDEPSTHLVYAVATPDGKGNGLFALPLRSIEGRPRALSAAEAGRYTHLTWAEDSSRLAFVAAIDDDLHDPGPADVWWWDAASNGRPKRLAAASEAPEGWRIPSKNRLTWSKDGERLFFGYQWIDPVVEKRRQEKKTEEREKKRKEREESERAESGEDDDTVEAKAEPYDPYDVDALLEDRELDVWHTDDPYIIPNQKIRWKNTEKDRVHLAVAHVTTGKIVRLADRDLPDVRTADNARAVIATSNLDYRRRVTWDGNYVDLYHVALDDGERRLVAKELRRPTPSLSPDGRYLLYWADEHWHLFDAEDGSTRNLTAGLDVPFADEDDDYPAPDPGYGVADWIEGDRAVLIYDKFDVWRFPTDGGVPVNLTAGQGRDRQRLFRLVDLEPNVDFRRDDEVLLLHGYHDRRKNDGYWRTRADRPALEKILEEEKRFRVRAKAEKADRILYTRESYDEFPDLWVADASMGGGRRLSDANPETSRFARGTAELVEWISADGIPLQGILIKPGNYQPGKRYPVLVYYYRFFSQRLHQFNQPVVNHRPSFPVYASHGYAVFLPDIRFEIGRPGMSAVKALVPGVQKLIDMGVADPDAIGLHGHSWSGYQTAHVVTQTNLFAAAVAGAPVSNMTSAYSGIRLGSGLARQFQYEQSQSRIGGSLDAELPKYIENSPVFHARHIETPLLIQFGDRDEAVPWQQGIELYLAMRRLDKDVIFLQYRGEPHHLKKYANKLDYSIKMMEFFDHHLKGAPAPTWISEGIPYRGE